MQKFHILHHIPVTEISFIMKSDYELRRREDGRAVGHVCLIDAEGNGDGKGWRCEMDITPDRLGLLAQVCSGAGVDWPEEPHKHVSGYEVIVPNEGQAYTISKVVDDEPKHARGRQQAAKAVELRSAAFDPSGHRNEI